MKLNAWLRKARSRGVTVRDFARRVGVSERSLFRYLSSERVPRPPVMARIIYETKRRVGPADFYATRNDDDEQSLGMDVRISNLG